MEEIKVGEYVRTYNGVIGKVIRITDAGNYAIRIYNGAEYAIKAVILKHSKNIIDLIEVGDILKIKEDNEIAYIGLERDTTTITYQDIIDEIKNNKIKLLSIVTKEMMKSIEYIVK